MNLYVLRLVCFACRHMCSHALNAVSRRCGCCGRCGRCGCCDRWRRWPLLSTGGCCRCCCAAAAANLMGRRGCHHCRAAVESLPQLAPPLKAVAPKPAPKPAPKQRRSRAEAAPRVGSSAAIDEAAGAALAAASAKVEDPPPPDSNPDPKAERPEGPPGGFHACVGRQRGRLLSSTLVELESCQRRRRHSR